MNHSEVWPQEEMFCCGNGRAAHFPLLLLMHLIELPASSQLLSGRQLRGDANMCRGVSEDTSFLGEVLLSSAVPPAKSSFSESLTVHDDLSHGCQCTFLKTLALQNCSIAVLRTSR